MLHSLSFAQTQSRRLEIYSITEYIDGYVIAAIDTSKADTVNLISVKDARRGKGHFEKMVVGKEYNFEYVDYISKMAAISPNSFVIRIKTTVVWRDSDENKKRPVFARNTKGLWIEQ
jgi:hypothetical protein